MIEYYPQIKWLHVAAVIASGGLFLLRGLAVQAKARWPMIAPVRYLSYGIAIARAHHPLGLFAPLVN